MNQPHRTPIHQRWMRRRHLRRTPDGQIVIWALRALRCALGQRKDPPTGDALEVFDTLFLQMPPHRGRRTGEQVVAMVEQQLATFEAAGATRGVQFTNVATLGRALGLTALEQDLVAFALALNAEGGLSNAIGQLGIRNARDFHEVLPQILGADPEAIRQALDRHSPLMKLRIVRHGDAEPLELAEGLDQILSRMHPSEDTLFGSFFEATPEPKLGLDAFEHVRPDVDALLAILAGAHATRVAGVNVLVHGPPGTGKTQLALALSRQLGAHLVQVKSDDDEHDAITGSRRFASYAICQRMLARAEKALVLFDEIEDVFPARAHSLFGAERYERHSGSDKGWTSHLLEENPVPALWISNEISHIDRAFVRRFAYVLELGRPPRAVRRRLLETELAGLPLTPYRLGRLADDPRLTPAHVATAARAARLAAPTDAAGAARIFERTLDRNLAPFGRAPVRALGHAVGPGYDLSCVNADVDLDALVRSLAPAPACNAGTLPLFDAPVQNAPATEATPRGSICLHGPPGTGKTAFVRHLADRLGLPLVAHRASDLMDCFLGETEKRIARMFRDAREERALLFLDEADSFLRERAFAQRSWEVSQVNEMLVRMESFEGLFVCATNLFGSLDHASLRRFALKIRFSPLGIEQAWKLLVAALREGGVAVPRGADAERLRAVLGRLRVLTPGDFAAVKQRVRLLGGARDAAGFVTALEGECAMKREGGAEIGFGR